MNGPFNVGDTVECGDCFRVVEGEIIYEKFIITAIDSYWGPDEPRAKVWVEDENGNERVFDEDSWTGVLMVVGS